MESDLKWDAEIVLTDTLDTVFKNLNARDLCRAAQVCKSWNHAVKLEFSRRGPERILIPNPHDPTLEDSEFRVANILRTKPSVVILFCGPKPHFRAVLDLEVDTLSAYNSRFPHRTKLIIMGVSKVVRDETEILSCPTNPWDKSTSFNILGLVLPKYRNVKYEVAYCESHERKSCWLAQEVASKLPPTSAGQKSILIVFGRAEYSTSAEVLKIIKKTYKSHTYTLWGGTTEGYLKIINCRKGDFPSYLGMQSVICLRITGEGIEAHTTVLSCTLSISEVTKKLLEFREKAKLRRHKLGLVCGVNSNVITSNVTSYHLVDKIKEIFFEISFTTIYKEHLHCFGLDSTIEDPDQELLHKGSVSLMILTYD